MWVSEGLDGQMGGVGLILHNHSLGMGVEGQVRVVYIIGLTRQVWTNYLEGGYLRVGGLNV